MHNWPQILKDYGPVIWKQTLRMLGNENDAADCYQIVMLEAFEFSKKQKVQNWSALLKRLATLRSLDSLRSRYRHSAKPLPDAEPDDPGAAQALKHIDSQDLAESLRTEIAKLPDDQSEAFTLRWINELSNEEVAESMQISTNHAAVLLHRARKTLRDRLTRKFEE